MHFLNNNSHGFSYHNNRSRSDRPLYSDRYGQLTCLNPAGRDLDQEAPRMEVRPATKHSWSEYGSSIYQ